VFGAHFGLEVGHGGVLAFGVAGTPLSEETDRQAAEHPQDPDRIAVSDAALIFVGRGVEPLMKAALYAPILPVGLQPLSRIQALRIPAGQHPDGFGFMFPDVAVQLRGLCDMREASLLRGGRLRVNLAAFPPSLV